MYMSNCYCVTGSHCKDRWVKVRDNHRKALQRRNTKSGQAAKKIKPPKYEKELTFLVPYLIDYDNRQSNFTPSAHTPPSREESNDFGEDENEEAVDLHETPASTVLTSAALNSPASISTALTTSSATSSSNMPTANHKKRNRSGYPPEKTAANVLQDYLAQKNNQPSKTQEPEDSLTAFFMTMAKTVKGFPLRDQIDMKKKIFQLVSDREMDIALAISEPASERSPNMAVNLNIPTTSHRDASLPLQGTIQGTHPGVDDYNVFLSLGSVNRILS